MKRFLPIYIIIYSIFVNNFALAAGLQRPPEASFQVPSKPIDQQIPQPTQKLSPLIPPSENTPFNATILPIQKAIKPCKPLEIGTSAEVSTYQKISLPDAINYALAHSMEIKSTRMETDKAKNDVKTANRLRNPYFQSYFNGGKAATDNPNYFGLMFPIDIAKRGARKKLAKSTLELTKGNVALAEFNLRMDVRQAYVDLVATKSTLKIIGEQRKLLQELLYIAQKKYEAGASPEMDVIQAKMTLNQLLIQENSARNDVVVSRYNFNKILDSMNYDTKEDYLPTQNDFIFMLTPKAYEKMPDYKQVLDIATAKRIDIKNAKQDIDIAQKNLVLTIKQRIPDIEIGGGYIFVPQQMATADEFTQGYYIGGNITNIPLLYQYSPEIKNAKLVVEQKELAYNHLIHSVSLDLHSAYDKFNTAQANLNYYNDILLSESKQFLGMSKRSYEVGKTNITNFIFIQQSYKSILMGYTEALADYYDAWVDLLREINDEEIKLHG